LFEYKPPVVGEAPKVEEKKKEPVLPTPRSDESLPEGEEEGEPKAAEVVEEVEEEVPYVKPAGKQTLEDIREQIQYFYQAEEDMMNLSNDFVDFQMFRVKSLSLKTKLKEKA
jgi:hypothetical protein